MRKLPKKLLTAFVVTTLAGACLHFLYVLLHRSMRVCGNT